MKRTNLIVILLLIYNQVALLFYCIQAEFSPISLFLLCLSVICNNTMIVIFHKQESKKQLAKELEEVELKMAQDQNHYQELEKKREEMAKIRHDYNNFLSTISGLIRVGNEEEAKELLAEIIREMKEPVIQFR